MESILFVTAILGSFLFLGMLKKRFRPALPLPPGPRGYPIIGNILAMPSVTPWKRFREWSNVYGMFGNTVYPLYVPGNIGVLVNITFQVT